MFAGPDKKKKMITIASKKLSTEKGFRQTGCFRQFTHLIHAVFLSG
jgi:hypothetical protein